MKWIPKFSTILWMEISFITLFTIIACLINWETGTSVLSSIPMVDFGGLDDKCYILGGILVISSLLILLIIERLQQKSLNSKLDTLRAQMNPHFISNSLNAIENLIQKDQKTEASKYLIHFSRLSRKVLSGSYQKNSTLHEDIDRLKHFLALAELRFKDKLSFQIKIDKDLNPMGIVFPSLLLQPYVENAIWHGIKPKDGPGNLEIYIKKEAKDLVCIIEDDGIGRTQSEKLKEENTFKRQDLTTEISAEKMDAIKKVRNGRIKVEDLDQTGENRGTRITLRIPFKTTKNT